MIMKTMHVVAMTVLLMAAHAAAAAETDGGPKSRYWRPFESLPIQFDYVCPSFRGDTLELWMARVNQSNRSECILVSQTLVDGNVGEQSVAFTTKIIRTFPDRHDPTRPAEVVRLSRTSVQSYSGRGYVALLPAFGGDPYGGGQHPLLPLVFSSPTGKPGDWACHGRLSGEPEKMENSKRLWCDGGSIIPLADGRWRVYLNGYGPAIAACEAASLDGPWTFVRDDEGRIRDVASVLPVREKMRGGAIFPYLLRVSEREYHLWVCDQWLCTAVWHLTSADGLDFRPYGEQPEITLADSGGAPIKGIRACVTPDGTTILGLIPFFRNGGWNIHRSVMPVGLQPAADQP